MVPTDVCFVATRNDTELSVSRDDSGDLEVILLHVAGSHIELDLMPSSYIAITSNAPILVVQVRNCNTLLPDHHDHGLK